MNRRYRRHTATTFGLVAAFVTLAACGVDVLLGAHTSTLAPADGSSSSGDGGDADDDTGGEDGGAPNDGSAIDPPDATDGAADAGCADDLATSPTSCGACGHDCGGSVCVAGVCAPIQLADGLDGPIWIDTDGVDVFWTENGGAVGRLKPTKKVAVAGGAVTTLLVGDQGRIAGVHVDGPSLFVAHRTPTTFFLHGLQKTDGGGSRIGLDTTGQPQTVTSDATSVYVAMAQDVRRFSKTDLDVPGTPVGAAFVEAWGIALDGTSLFVTDRTTGDVALVNTVTNVTTILAPAQGKLAAVTYDATTVYFAGRDIVARVPRAGGPVTVLATGFGESLGIAVSGGYVYWTTAARILAVPIGGGATLDAATGFAQIGHLAHDARFLYFPDFAAGAIYKVAKLPPR